MKKTLAIVYPECIEFEIQLALELLHPRFPVEVASPDGGIHAGHNGVRIAPHYRFADVKAEDYAVVLVPGGDPGSVVDNGELQALLARLHRAGANFGAICAGPLLLDRPGILRGRRVAHGFAPDQLREFLLPRGHFLDCTLSDAPFESGANLVTAKATAYRDFAIELAWRAGAYPDRAAAAARAKIY